MDNQIQILVSGIIKKYDSHQLSRTFTVALSGIDAAGKGYISSMVKDVLQEAGYAVALINIDPWQNPLPVRLQKDHAAENLYEHIFRWDDFFGQLIFPLQKNKSIYLETKGIRSDADLYYPLVYNFRNIDILLVEGIFLFKQQYLSYFDYRIWIDCSFETGLQRAIARNAEGLNEAALVHDYQTFYYPAQRYHFKKDDPLQYADLIIDNN